MLLDLMSSVQVDVCLISPVLAILGQLMLHPGRVKDRRVKIVRKFMTVMFMVKDINVMRRAHCAKSPTCQSG